MQIVFLPPLQMLLLFFFLWPAFQVSIALLCLKIPVSKLHYGRFVFRTRAWEKNGLFYRRFFKVHKWKKFLPDGGAVTKKGFRKKVISDYSPEYLEKFLAESCRAEIAHWISIVPFWIFGFFGPPVVIPIMFLYALVLNVPCIIAQRYNRPRIIRILRSPVRPATTKDV